MPKIHCFCAVARQQGRNLLGCTWRKESLRKNIHKVAWSQNLVHVVTNYERGGTLQRRMCKEIVGTRRRRKRRIINERSSSSSSSPSPNDDNREFCTKSQTLLETF
jgi:hypothetical protein